MEITSIGGWIRVKKVTDRKIVGYIASAALTGIVLVLLTGCMMPEPQTNAWGGQAQKSALPTPDVKAAQLQISNTMYNHSMLLSSLTPLTAKNTSIKIPYKKGEKVNLADGLPLFSGRKDSRTAADQMKITYRTIPSETYTLTDVQGDWIQLKTREKDRYWLPGWYALKQSGSMTETDLRTFEVRTGSKLHLTPDSAVTWQANQVLTNQALLVAEWKEWYGVSIAPRIWNKEETSYQHVLLWIKKKDITDQKLISDGWFTKEQPLSISFIRHLTDARLNQTTTTKQSVKWLGEPDWKEQSRNLNDTGYPMRIGQTWRYERQDAHVLLTFNKNNKLTEVRWNVPSDQSNNEIPYWSSSRFNVFSYTAQVTGKSMPPTLSWKPKWVNQGNLNYTFLQAGTDDVLLMKGDDGGFSGMHYEDAYYALDRQTGKMLWRVHAGYGPAQAFLNYKRDAVTLYTSYDTERKQYVDRVRHMNLKNGKVIWEYKPAKENPPNSSNKQRTKPTDSAGDIVELKGIKAAQNVVIVDTFAAKNSSNGRIHVLNSSNGKPLWSRKLTTGYQLMNQSADEPYVMYWEQNKLTAADPLTGRTMWQVDSEKSVFDYIENNPYFDGIYRSDPFASVPLQRWMLLNDQWVLLDLSSGRKLSRFPARGGQQPELLQDGMMLIREHKKGDLYGDYEDYTTALYDPESGKVRWKLDAKIERGLIEGDRLYVIMNGYPAAIDYRTGETRWIAKESIGRNRYALNQGSYLVIGERLLLPMHENLLVMNKKDGTLLGRVQDVVMGTPEHRDREAKNGMINRAGSEVYVGSANGRFRVLPANLMEGDISP